jgi:hypothetical protein
MTLRSFCSSYNVIKLLKRFELDISQRVTTLYDLSDNATNQLLLLIRYANTVITNHDYLLLIDEILHCISL